MKLSRLFFIFAFILVSTSCFVSAVPPLTTVFTGDTGINVEIQIMPVYEYGEPRWSIIHLFNQTSGYQITNITNPDVSCHLHLRDSQGFEIMDIEAIPHLDHFDLNGSFGGMSPIGSYAWTVACNDDDAEVGGYISGYFEITESGTINTVQDSLIYSSFLFILFILLILILFLMLKTENFGIKMGLTSFAYIIANVLLLVCWKISERLLTAIPFLETIFRVLYIVSNVGYLPMFIGVFVASLIHMTNEKNINTLMERGYSEDRAISMTKRK